MGQDGPLTFWQIVVVSLCVLANICDGLDTTSIAYAAPSSSTCDSDRRSTIATVPSGRTHSMPSSSTYSCRPKPEPEPEPADASSSQKLSPSTYLIVNHRPRCHT